jgi:hypothetical protein
MCRWRATYLWKAFDKGYNFALDLISIKGLHKKLWASKIVRASILRIFEIPNLGVLGKTTFGCSPHG